jgi:hypothetical protein
MNRACGIGGSALLVVIGLCGCQSNRIFRDPGDAIGQASVSRSRVILASSLARQDPPEEQEPSADGLKTESTKQEPSDDRKAEEEAVAGEKARDLPYTPPPMQIQQLTLLLFGVIPTSATVHDANAKLAAESGVTSSSTAIVGRPQLTAPPQTRFTTTVVGRPGLQRGFASGIGFASPDRNIFTARFNPASGSAGRCGDLIKAGFFNRDRGACEAHFRR